MNLFEKLSEEDKKNIEKYIKYYGNNDPEEKLYTNCELEYLLRFWNKNKVNLYHTLGDNFIIKKDIEYIQPIEEIISNINDITDRKFIWLYHDKLIELCEEHNNKDEYDWSTRYAFASLTDSSCLANNKYTGNTIKITVGDKKIVCQNGTKPFKILGKFAKLFGIEEEYEKFRIAVSVATNQKKLKGTLCLSIHPLDYMTMSDNDSDWSSCMSWKEDGCYRRGTIEMMNSKNVIVAYLTAKEDMDLGWGETWNNKKWRSLFIVDDLAAVSVKAYPYHNSEISMLVLDWIKELTGKKYSHADTIAIRQRFNYDGKTIYFSPTTNTMYNDFGTTIHYGMFDLNALEEHCATNGDSNYDYRVKICYSGEDVCLSCGREGACYNTEGDLLCCDCDPRIICADCGEYLYEDDAYELDGEYYCESCYYDCSMEDDITHETHHCDNMATIYLGSKEQDSLTGLNIHYDTTIHVHCDTIDNYYLWEDYCTVPADTLILENKYREKYINAEDLNDEGAQLFGYSDYEDMINNIVV